MTYLPIWPVSGDSHPGRAEGRQLGCGPSILRSFGLQLEAGIQCHDRQRFMGDSLGPWWREGWDNTLFGGANATLRTRNPWLSDDGATGGSPWTSEGRAQNGEPSSIQGTELSRYGYTGLITELVMFCPYGDDEARRRFIKGHRGHRPLGCRCLIMTDCPRVRPRSATQAGRPLSELRMSAAA